LCLLRERRRLKRFAPHPTLSNTVRGEEVSSSMGAAVNTHPVLVRVKPLIVCG
jgi:hypothetical protein